MNTTTIGQTIESFVADFLRRNGLVILHQNYRVGRKEADIVACQGNTLVIVEVKARAFALDMYSLQQTITQAKRQRMVRIADAYLKRHNNKFTQVRFDFACVCTSPLQCTYIPGAFYP